MLIYHSNCMPTVTVYHSLAALSHGCNMTYVILRYICLLLNNILMQLGDGLWHCASPSYAAIQFNPFTLAALVTSTSITLMLFVFRKTVKLSLLLCGLVRHPTAIVIVFCF